MASKLSTQTSIAVSELGQQLSDATIQMHEAIARNVGLAGTDHKYLRPLMQKGAMTAGELAQLTGLTTGAITGLVDRLEKKQLVKRKFDPADRRKVVIVPDQEKAKQLLNPIFATLQQEVLTLMEQFDEQEIVIIKRYLIATIEMLKNTTERLAKPIPENQ